MQAAKSFEHIHTHAKLKTAKSFPTYIHTQKLRQLRDLLQSTHTHTKMKAAEIFSTYA
jgi:hypothetical protein